MSAALEALLGAGEASLASEEDLKNAVVLFYVRAVALTHLTLSPAGELSRASTRSTALRNTDHNSSASRRSSLPSL